MGLKLYTLFSVAYVIFIGLFVNLFIDADTYKLVLTQNIGFTLKVYLWVVLPLIPLVILTIIHLMYYGLKVYIFKNNFKKDFRALKYATYDRILQKENNHKFKTEEFSYIAKIIKALEYNYSKNFIDLKDKQKLITEAISVVDDISNKNVVDLKKYKLADDNPLILQNEMNKLEKDKNHAFKILKKYNNLEMEIVQVAYKTIIDFASFREVQAVNLPLNKENVKVLIHRYVNEHDELELDFENIKNILEKVDLDEREYVGIVESLKVKVEPEILIKILLDLSIKNNSAKAGYLFALYEFRMIDKLQEVVSNLEEGSLYEKYKLVLFLNDNNKNVGIDFFR